jgi:hypothetical protein
VGSSIWGEMSLREVVPAQPRSRAGEVERVKTYRIISGVLSLVFWIASALLWYHYALTRPSRPEPEVGRIYAHRQIGEIFYLTAHEQLLWRSLALAGVAFFILAVVIYQCERYFGHVPRAEVQRRGSV